jgi:hypothetical protein
VQSEADVEVIREENGKVTTTAYNDEQFESSFFSVSMQIGAGLEYSLGGNTSIIGGITFQNGLTTIDSNDEIRFESGSGGNVNIDHH